MRARGKRITSTSDSVISCLVQSQDPVERTYLVNLQSLILTFAVCASYHMKMTCWKELEPVGSRAPAEDGFMKTVQKTK